MYFPDFLHANEDGRLQILYQWGTCLATRYEGQLRLLLYQVAGFYVEVVFDPGAAQVQELRCFEDPALLDPYLEAIDISGLLPGA